MLLLLKNPEKITNLFKFADEKAVLEQTLNSIQQKKIRISRV